MVDPAVAAEELATAEQQMTAATAELEKVVAVQTSERKRLEREANSLEAQLLEALASAEGNILDNVVLLESLTKTKETSAQIGESLDKSAEASIGRSEALRNALRQLNEVLWQ